MTDRVNPVWHLRVRFAKLGLLRSLRILVVDDNEAVRRGLRSLLAASADWLLCGEAVDGLEAVEKAKTLRPDIVLMDISMPRMNGLDATRIIRRELPETKVVIVSQGETTVVLRQAKEVDAAGCIAKADLFQELLPTLDRLTGRRDTADASSPGLSVLSSRQNLPGTRLGVSVPISDGDEIVAESKASQKGDVADARKLAEGPTDLLAAIVDSSDDAIVSKNLDGIISSWNKGAERLFGYSAEEAIGQHITLIIPPGRRGEEVMILDRIKRGERVEHFETVRLCKGGTTLDVSLTISPVKDATGRIVGASKVARDITERKQSERATGLLAAIVDSSDDAIVSKNLDGIISSWNKGAERLFGYSAEEAIGQHITLIIPPGRRSEEVMILERLKRGERVEHFETIRVRKDGEELDISLTISPVKDGAGRVVGASKVARDITEQKRAERALRESEERLRTLTDGLETQVRARTRELEQRNVEVLEQSEQLRELSNRLLQTQDDERRRIARELHDSAGQVLTALSLNLASITEFARQNLPLEEPIQDGHKLIQQLSKEVRTMSYLLHPPLLDENGLSQAIRWYVEGLMERSDLKIELGISENFGRLPRDMELSVFRILQECLTNIHRHSDSKTATIRLSRRAEGVSLEVEDDGKGISAEKLAGIQAQRSGVGITGMRERVRHFGGAMDIQSGGQGTRILVELPFPMTASSESGSELQRSRSAR